MDDPALARRHADLAWWQSQADQVERHRRGMRWIPVVGLPAALVVAFVHPLLGSAIVAVTALLSLMGLYMTAVRQHEFRGHIASAREEIAVLERRGRPAVDPRR